MAAAARACADCGRAFRYPSELRRHQQRRTPCKRILDPEDLPPEERANPHCCHFCGRTFKHASNMYTHMRKSCSIARTPEGLQELYLHTQRRKQREAARTAPVAEPEPEPSADMRTALRQAQQQIQQLQGRLDEQSRRLEQLHLAAAPESRQVSVQLNQYITINVFCHENVDHIDSACVKRLLDEALAAARSPLEAATLALGEAAALVFGSRQRPENLTCFLPEPRAHLEAPLDLAPAMVRRAGGWDIDTAAKVLPRMAGRVADLVAQLQPFDADYMRYCEVLRALLGDSDSRASELRPVLERNRALLADPEIRARLQNPPPRP